MIGTNEEIKLMSLPLTYAMGINVLFILGAVYVPHLWDIVEYLFPFAILAFFIVGLYASKLFFNYFNDTLAKGNFDFVNNNSLGQMIAPFAFIMVSVGLAASVAMSHTTWTNVIALVSSLFFLTLTIFLINIKLVLGFKSIFKYGVDKKAAPTLWIVIPIMTLTGITLVRLISGIYHHIIGANPPAIVFLIILSVLVALQLIFALIGYGVMKRHQYFETFVEGQAFEVGSFALICPGVAFVVLGMFFVNFGFVKTGFIDKYSLSHYLMVLPFVYVQIKTIFTLNKLNRKSKSQLFI